MIIFVYCVSLLVISNDVHDAGLLAVANLMQVNSVLSQLHIWGNKWTTPTCDVSQNMLLVNILFICNRPGF